MVENGDGADVAGKPEPAPAHRRRHPEQLAARCSPCKAWLSDIRPHKKDLKSDVLAGLPGAISSVPDGMATALLAGVNPAYGLYASFSGKIGGGLSTSTKLMVVTTTTAASLAAGSALAEIPAENRDSALDHADHPDRCGDDRRRGCCTSAATSGSSPGR